MPIIKRELLLWEFEFSGRVPSKKNNRVTVTKGINAGKSFPSRAYREWHQDCALQMNGMEPHFTFRKAKVSIKIIFPDLRKTDVDNKETSILDFLQDMGVIADDSWTTIGVPRRACEYRKGEAGFLVRVQGLRENEDLCLGEYP